MAPAAAPPPSTAALVETAAEFDLSRYVDPASIWEALATRAVQLVKMSFLISFSEAGGILPRRQDLPEEAFISVEELKQLYGDGNRDGVLPIVVISFCWLTPPHPDPEGKQLATVAARLKQDRELYAKVGFLEMGVFWDWVRRSPSRCRTHLPNRILSP